MWHTAFVVFLFHLGLMVGCSVGSTVSLWISVYSGASDWGVGDEEVKGSGMGLMDGLCIEASNLFWACKVPCCSSNSPTVTKSDVFDDGKVLGCKEVDWGQARRNPVGFWRCLAGRTSLVGFGHFDMEVIWRNKKDGNEWNGYKGWMT